jgi:integrase
MVCKGDHISDDDHSIRSEVDTRDRALILLLLQTGIGIGEALALTMNDIDLTERKVHLVQGEKNNMGRVVYLSNDATFCPKRWFRYRDPEKRLVFYGKGDAPICYSTARFRFFKYLQEAGLGEKGYTIRCLRHTNVSELLNAGTRLEALQQTTLRPESTSPGTTGHYSLVPQVPFCQQGIERIGAAILLSSPLSSSI